jgi:DNA-binding GntR family transcriptional regulator
MQYAQIKELLQFLVYYDAEHDEEALADHEKIVNALLQHDKKKTLTELENHLNRVCEQLIADFNRNP